MELFFQILALCVSFAIKIGSKQTDPIQIHGMFSNEKNIDPRFLRHKSPLGIKEWRDIYNLFLWGIHGWSSAGGRSDLIVFDVNFN